MRAKLTIGIFLLIISCKNKTDYLVLAENEINLQVEKKFQTDTIKYWSEIENLFYDYSVEKGYLNNSNEKWKAIENYLKEFEITGLTGMESEKYHERFLELRKKLIDIKFLVDTNNLFLKGVNYKLLYNIYNPIIEKYRPELDSIIEIKPELIYGIGTTNPNSTHISIMLSVGGILANYNKEDYIKPVVQKSILLTIFCHHILFSYNEPEFEIEYEDLDSVLILEDTCEDSI